MSNSGPAKAPTGGLSVCAAPHMQSTVYDGGQGRAGGKRKACRCAPCCLRPEIASSCRSPKVCVCHDFIMFCAVMSPLSNMHTQAPCTAHTGWLQAARGCVWQHSLERAGRVPWGLGCLHLKSCLCTKRLHPTLYHSGSDGSH